MLEDVRSKIADSQIAHRIQVYAENGPRVSVVLVGALVLTGVLAAPVYGWHIGRERDKWWRAEIAKQSSAVRGVIERGSAEAEATDADVLKALGEDHAKLHAEVARLKTANKPVQGCAPVPAHCLGLLGQ